MLLFITSVAEAGVGRRMGASGKHRRRRRFMPSSRRPAMPRHRRCDAAAPPRMDASRGVMVIKVRQISKKKIIIILMLSPRCVGIFSPPEAQQGGAGRSELCSRVARAVTKSFIADLVVFSSFSVVTNGVKVFMPK